MADFIHLFELIVLTLVCVILYRIRGLIARSNEADDEISLVSNQEESEKEETELSPVEQYLLQANQRADELNDGILGIDSQFFASRESEGQVESVKVIDQAKSFIELQIDKLRDEVDDHYGELGSTISCFLIGAADFMGKQASYCEKTRIELVEKVLQEGQNYSDKLSQASYDEAFQDENIHIARAGAKAAKIWLKTPANSNFSLTSYLKDWHVA